MYKLFILPLCPLSNRAMILSRKLNYDITIIPIYNLNKLLSLTEDSTFLNIPALMIDNDVIFGSELITQYFQEQHKNHNLFNNKLYDKINNLDSWITNYLYNNIFIPLFFHKHIKDFYNYTYEISFDMIINAKNLLEKFLNYLNNNIINNGWISSSEITINDITCFGFLASMDYGAYINWNKYIHLKQWYMRMKSSEDFNFILQYSIPHTKPTNHYKSLDF
jgi:glutathione S-transferase